MKKTLAIVLSLILIMSLAIPTFAASSPVAGQKVTTVLVEYDGAKPQVDTHTFGDDLVVTYTAKSEHNGAAFVGWIFYLKDGSPAVEGRDYKAVKNAAAVGHKELTVEFIPLTDLIVTANYGTTTTSTKDAVATFQSTSVPTGDATVVCLSVVLFVALAGVCVSKKQLAK